MKKIVKTENAPAALGPYSQAVRVGNFLFVSGQVAIDPKTGEMVGSDAPTQAEQVFKNLKAILEAEGYGFEHVVKATVFAKNMDDFKAVNEVYGRFFTSDYPARAFIEVARLPKDALVEIEVIAYKE